MDKFVEIFCDIDDFFRVFIPEREKQLIADGNIKRKRPCRMAMSEIFDAKLTTGNVHDTKPILELTKNLKGKLYVDKGYISKKLTANLKEKDVDLVTTVRSKMKGKLYHYRIEQCYLGDLLSKRLVIS